MALIDMAVSKVCKEKVEIQVVNEHFKISSTNI